MMELKDFEKFVEFTKQQITILKEKEADKYKDDSWKNWDEEDLFDALEEQMDGFDYTSDSDKKYKQRRMLHIGNIAFFIWHKLEEE